MRHPLLLTVFLPALLLSTPSCKKSETTGPEVPFVDAVITHMGFDFSAGKADTVDYSNNDGETITWMPDGGTNPLYPAGSNVWYRTSNNFSMNETRDMGTVDLASVKTAPASWDSAPDIPPLQVGHVVVAACKDGFVKFQVLSVDTTGFWPAGVRYEFSSTTAFQ